MRATRKIAVAFVAVAATGGFILCWPLVSSLRYTLPYDLAYQTVAVGDSLERVEGLLGEPHYTYPGWDGTWTKCLVYRVDDGFRFPLKWTISLDSAGRVKCKSRKRDPC